MELKHRLYTIGYEKRSIKEFIDRLIKAEVDILVDVRQIAWSYRPEYCKTRLNRRLKASGIDYLHLPEAGNPKEYRVKAKSIQSCLILYRNYLGRTKSGLNELKSIIQQSGAGNRRVCITCYEKDHQNCHRSIIIEFMRRRITPLSVVHL